MSEIKEFSYIVENIYAAIESPKHWEKVLEIVVKALCASSGSMIYMPDHKRSSITVSHNLSEKTIREYNEKYAKIDPLMPLLQSSLEPGDAKAEHHFFPDRERLEEEHHTFLYESMYPANIYHSGGVNISLPDAHGFIMIMKSRDQGILTDSNLQSLKLLAPHFIRALSLYERISLMASITQNISECMHYANIGIITLDASGLPIFINEKASSILQNSNEINLKNDHLYINNPKKAQLLNDIINELLTKQPTDTFNNHRAIKLGTIDIVLSRYPNIKEIKWPFIRDIRILVLLGTAQDIFKTEIQILTDLYNITKTEAKILSGLCTGNDINKIADNHHLSQHTVRTHIKSIFRKTKTNRQAELVSKVLNGPSRFILTEYESGTTHHST